jgi:lipoprotein signal peptidase
MAVDSATTAVAMVRRRVMGFGVAAAAITLVLDQLSKWWIVGHLMNPPRAFEITPFFNLVMVWNRGITFGLFGDAQWGRWAFALLALEDSAIVVGVGLLLLEALFSRKETLQ